MRAQFLERHQFGQEWNKKVLLNESLDGFGVHAGSPALLAIQDSANCRSEIRIRMESHALLYQKYKGMSQSDILGVGFRVFVGPYHHPCMFNNDDMSLIANQPSSDLRMSREREDELPMAVREP